MSSLFSKIKKAYWYYLSDRTQTRQIIKYFNDAAATNNWAILDVACGYGRNLKSMKAAGFNPVGVDINPVSVEAVRKDGYECHFPGDPEIIEKKWDAILMSHIIEHFDYQSLFEMMNGYLDVLKPNGVLIIATPLLNNRFYDNFDHVKPYTPIAIENVFGKRGLQVQFQSKHELLLENLWLRRRPYCIQLMPSLLRRGISSGKIFFGLINVLLVVAHILSFRLISSTDGWVGSYRLRELETDKKSDNPAHR